VKSLTSSSIYSPRKKKNKKQEAAARHAGEDEELRAAGQENVKEHERTLSLSHL